MATFEEFRHLLVLYYDANLISDEEFLVLYEMFPSKNLNFPYENVHRSEVYVFEVHLRIDRGNGSKKKFPFMLRIQVLYAYVPKTYLDDLDFTVALVILNKREN